MSTDPFRFCPELRAMIKPAEQSFFRTFQPAHLDERMAEQGLPPTWRYTEDEREAYREAALARRPDADLWVFAYGSLIWDPAFCFAEVRRASVASHARHFILVDRLGGRGDKERPGVMAALDRAKPGESPCQGVVFRIAEADLDEETRILWRRERLMPGYLEEFLAVDTPQGPVSALAFTADTRAEQIEPALPRAQQIEFLATGKGMLGTSLDYIENLAEHFAALKIEDPDLFALLEDAKAYRAAAG